jgi:hypothetical protein
MSGLFWTLILANYTDDELSELSRRAKRYEERYEHVLANPLTPSSIEAQREGIK